MHRRFIGVLLFAFIVASGGGLITYRMLLDRPSQGSESAQMTQIVVAAHDLEAGAVLRDGDLRLAEWPGSPPAGASANPQDLIGRGVVMAIYSREPVIDSRLAPKGAGGGLPAMIPPGMRAFAIRVNDVAGVAGFAIPGMRVDVVISGSAAGTGATLARTLLQNVEVLSAGQDFKKDAEGKPIVSQVVTLLVSPEQAEDLTLAANQTSIQLVLRNPMDREVAEVPAAAFSSLFGTAQGEVPAAQRASQAAPQPRPAAPRAAAPQAKPDPPFTMEIILGHTKTEATFPAHSASN
jgi:pilus assembly protein CpaB